MSLIFEASGSGSVHSQPFRCRERGIVLGKLPMLLRGTRGPFGKIGKSSCNASAFYSQAVVDS